MLDVAIVGGGVAGCYCAYRLAKSSKLERIELFEASDRIGGRLWSLRASDLKEVGVAPIELGGNWFGAGQSNVYNLITKELGLTTERVEWSDKRWFLRGVDLSGFDFVPSALSAARDECDKAKVPYRLKGEEIGKDPWALLDLAVERILGCSVDDLWPKSPTSTPHATMAFLESKAPCGRKLWEWGFWNLLAEKVSPEAYELMLSGTGLTSTFRNANALDAIWLYLAEAARGDGPFRLPEGYQSLPLALEAQCKDRVRFNRGQRLDRIEREGRDFVLHFIDSNDDKSKVAARRVILALPRRALDLIRMDYKVVGGSFRSDLDAVLPIPACKVYLLFDEAWWERSKVGPSRRVGPYVEASYTDLPMRQCHYFKGEPSSETALIMACYADETAASFWSALAKSPDEKTGREWVSSDGPRASNAVLRAALQQLTAMHSDIPAPDTNWRACFVDWGNDPYGAAWHAWAPHHRSSEVRARMRQPHKQRALYVCGEAFAQVQGWVEGAINSAELALRCAAENTVEPFELKRPRWVDASYAFEV